MANSILILGESGTGKTSSFEYLDPSSTLIISPNSKPLPWKGSASMYLEGKNIIRETSLKKAAEFIQKANEGSRFNTVVIDDLTHMMNHKLMSSDFANSTNWSKWQHYASEVYQVIIANHETFRKDLNVIIVAHTGDKDNGTIGMRTSGKILDQTIDVVSYFTVVLHARILKQDGKLRHVFQTNHDGEFVCKSPKGMFQEGFIDNNMKEVLEKVTNFYR